MSVAFQPRAVPYPGLRSFEEEDSGIFFGRQKQVAALLRKLEKNRFVAVVGSSGSGKSSLVKAGLLPAIAEGFLMETDKWEWSGVRPGRDPYAALEKALRKLCSRADSCEKPTDGDAVLGKILRQTDSGLVKVLTTFIPNAAKNILLIVDQFEELFSYRRATQGSEEYASRNDSAAFVSMLLASAKDPNAKVWVLITMRSDLIGDCEAFLGLPEQVSQSQFLVPRLDASQIREAIVRPSFLTSEGFDPFTVPEELVNLIISEAGDRPDQLPLMQHALMRTWKFAVERARRTGSPVRLTKEDYDRAGRIQNALSQHAEEAWQGLRWDPRKAAICRELFVQLCDLSVDGKIVRRRPQVVEAIAVTGATLPEIEAVVQAFQDDDRNFLLPPSGVPLTSSDYLDVTHEALLRQWGTYRRWQENERVDVAELRRLVELGMLRKVGQEAVGLLPAADLGRVAKWKGRVSVEWARRYVEEDGWNEAQRFVEASEKAVRDAEHKRKKEERKKSAWYFAIGLILVGASLFSLGTATFALRKRNEATVAANRAETERTRADAEKTHAKHAEIIAKNSEKTAKDAEAKASKSAQDALAQADAAKKARNAADDLIRFMQLDLSEKLQPLGKLDLIGDVAKQITDYQQKFPPLLGDQEAERLANLALSRYGDILLSQGKTEAALGYFKRSAEHLQKIAEEDYSLANLVDWASCLSKIGTIESQRKEFPEAKASLEKAYNLIDSAVKEKPASRVAQQALATIEVQRGDAAHSEWNLEGAFNWYVRTLETRKAIVDHDENCDDCQREYAQSLSRKGAVEIDQGAMQMEQSKWKDAHASLDEAVAILRKLIIKAPGNTLAQSDLSKALGNSAELAMEEYWADISSGAKLKAAQKVLDEAVAIRSRLAQQDLTNVDWQRDLYTTQIYRGEVYRALGGLGGLDIALRSDNDSLEIASRLSKGDPKNGEFRSLLAQSLEGVGDVYKSMGERVAAIENYEKCLNIRQELVKTEPNNSEYRGALAIAYASMAEVLANLPPRDLIRANELAEKALKVIAGLDPHDQTLTVMSVQFDWIKGIAYGIKRRLKK